MKDLGLKEDEELIEDIISVSTGKVIMKFNHHSTWQSPYSHKTYYRSDFPYWMSLPDDPE